MSAAGYVLVLSEDRAKAFDAAVMTSGSTFAEAVTDFEHSRVSSLVCFIQSRPGVITHIAAGARGRIAGTRQRRLNLDDIHALRRPVEILNLLRILPRRARGHAEEPLLSGGLIRGKTFLTLVDVLANWSQELKELLERFTERRREILARMSPKARQALADQKEALSTALMVADIDRRPLLQWSPPPQGQPRSFFQGLPQARLTEDQLVWHDRLRGLPGMTPLQPSISGVARFSSDEVTLDVVVANRNALEEQTGADLIYFNVTFQSFVMVQYKMMERDGSRSIFRLPNAHLAEQIARMNAIVALADESTAATHRDHYRLNEEPFFLKLCPRIVLNPDDIGLSQGIYVALEYWRHVEKDEDMRGPKGGRLVTFENIRRRFDNTAFAHLVRDGWVGTSPQQTKLLGPILEQIMKEGRAAVIAIENLKPEPVDDGAKPPVSGV